MSMIEIHFLYIFFQIMGKQCYPIMKQVSDFNS